MSSYKADKRIDRLNGYIDLLAWSRHSGMLSVEVTETLEEQAEAQPDQAHKIYKKSTDVREAIFSVFSVLARGSAPVDSDLEVLNTALRESAQHHVLRLSSTEGKAQSEDDAQSDISWSWDSEDHLARPLWPIIQSAAELLTTADLRRIKMCEGRDCTWLFLDESRNRSRRWCDMQTCGNRAKARRYREKDAS